MFLPHYTCIAFNYTCIQTVFISYILVDFIEMERQINAAVDERCTPSCSLLPTSLPLVPCAYDSVRCSQCHQNFVGDRDGDICYSCLPLVDHHSITQAYYFARRILGTISRRERHQGIPYVGAILISRDRIEVFKDAVGKALKGHNIKDHKVGFQRIVSLPGDDHHVVAHMSSHTAKNLMLYPELVSLNKTDANNIYFGVRACDPLFGGDFTRPVGSQFLAPGPGRDETSRFTFAEIFAGIGGFRLGLDPLHGQCVFSSEINEAARATMQANYPPTCTAGDITGVYAFQLPDFDILTAGFPCQPFSIRGQQGGLDDPRGQLFRELIRVMKVKQPKAFLFENVPGLVYLNGGKQNKFGEPFSMDIGETFRYILQEFENVGYDVSWRIIDAKHWLAQSRQRVYIMGFRIDLGLKSDNFWPDAGVTADGPGINITVRDILEKEPHCLVQLSSEQWEKMQTPEYIEKTNKWRGLVGGSRSREIDISGKAPTLTSGYKNPANEATKYIFEEADGTLRVVPRFLTPRECCRLMGFPESFRIPIEIGISAKGKKLNGDKCESQFYCQIGNAVCPPVIQAIASEMLRALRL